MSMEVKANAAGSGAAQGIAVHLLGVQCVFIMTYFTHLSAATRQADYDCGLQLAKAGLTELGSCSKMSSYQ